MKMSHEEHEKIKEKVKRNHLPICSIFSVFREFVVKIFYCRFKLKRMGIKSRMYENSVSNDWLDNGVYDVGGNNLIYLTLILIEGK